MEIKLEVKEDNVEFTKDGSAFDFTTEELEKLLDNVIDNNVTITKLADEDYEKYKADPYVALMYGIINCSDENCDFRKKLAELTKEKTDNEEQLKELE